MDKKIGFIGCGNMGQAMIGGIVKSGLVPPEQVYAADPSEQNLNHVQKEYGICVTQDNLVPAKKCDILVLSVKPYLYADVIEEIRDTVKQDVVIVMIAAGQTIAVNEARFGRNIKIVRAMPNTPALVGEGMAALCANSYVTDEEKNEVREIFESFGKAEFVAENMMDVVAGVSGSSPAFVYMFIEALADGVVALGIPRAQAYEMCAQAVLGAAKMVLETGLHPGVLKDQVCSPGGMTIQGVKMLEEGGFRYSVIAAEEAAFRKSQEMAK